MWLLCEHCWDPEEGPVLYRKIVQNREPNAF